VIFRQFSGRPMRPIMFLMYKDEAQEIEELAQLENFRVLDVFVYFVKMEDFLDEYSMLINHLRRISTLLSEH
jgi:hypothetical protein